MASARLRQPAASSAIAAFTAGAESSAAARSKRVAASLSSAAERGPASQGSVSHPAQHHSPHLVGCRIVRHRPHNPRGQRLELLVVPPLRLGQLGAHLPCQVGEGIPFAVDACVFSTRNLSIYRGLAPTRRMGQQMVGEVASEGPQPLRRCLFGGETLQL